MAEVWQWLRNRDDRVRDTLIVLLVATPSFLPLLMGSPPRGDGRGPDRLFSEVLAQPGWLLALQAAAIALLLVRRRWPLAVLTFTVAVGAISAFVAGGGGAALVIMVALFNLSLRAPRRTWVTATLVTAAVMAGVAIAAEPPEWQEAIGALIWVALPSAIAQAVRNRIAFVAATEERARVAEEARDEEARRQVAEERLRIARELHDVLAHSIAVINVQSGVAAHVIDRDPGQAKQALEHINDASDTAISELRATLDVLRQDGDQAAPTAPAPDLGQVDDLFTAARGAGLTVRSRVNGSPQDPPPETGLVAYRVIQEALTNVIKHAQAETVDVVLDINRHAMTLAVEDDGVGCPDPPPYGHGRTGMRERVHAVGGTLRDGPLEQGYRVSVTLPLNGNRR